MRNGQNNNKQRMRGRNNHHNNNMNNNRRGQNPLTRVYESNGPDIKIRGTASHLAEKYVQLARDALGSGDPVAAENFYQHAEHYFRIIAAAQEQMRQNQPNQGGQPRFEGEARDDMSDDGGDFSNFGTEPGLPREQPQPNYQQQPREHQQRDQQGHRDRNNFRDNRPPREMQQPQAHQPQPVETHSIDRLPSFITGGQPQPDVAMASENGEGAQPQEARPDRYPRRRRRPHNPRHDNAAPAADEAGAD